MTEILRTGFADIAVADRCGAAAMTRIEALTTNLRTNVTNRRGTATIAVTKASNTSVRVGVAARGTAAALRIADAWHAARCCKPVAHTRRAHLTRRARRAGTDMVVAALGGALVGVGTLDRTQTLDASMRRGIAIRRSAATLSI